MQGVAPITLYAPAELANPEQLEADIARFAHNELLEQFLAAVPDIFMVLNEQRQIVFANQAFLDLVGMQGIRQIAGMRTGDALGCVHAFDTEWGCGTSEFCRERGAIHAILTSIRGRMDVQECRIQLAGGGAMDLRVRTRLLTLDGHKYILFAVNDIADEKRRRVLERLFFHDILNTAGSMVGFAELIREQPELEVEGIKDTMVLLATNLLEEIKNQQNLLAAEAGELMIDEAVVDSLGVLAGVRDTYVHHEVATDRHIEIDASAEAITFISDRTLLRRVLSNMVKNALEACAPGETVTISCRDTRLGPEFAVHNPAFIPRNVQLQVFQRSFSTKGIGRGLGTYSMKLLTERYLGGEVWFETAEARGTTFFARVPHFPAKDD